MIKKYSTHCQQKKSDAYENIEREINILNNSEIIEMIENNKNCDEIFEDFNREFESFAATCNIDENDPRLDVFFRSLDKFIEEND